MAFMWKKFVMKIPLHFLWPIRDVKIAQGEFTKYATLPNDHCSRRNHEVFDCGGLHGFVPLT